LKWNEFSVYICDSFKELRDDTNFCDVTLACDDGEQIKANKVVLSSCSPVLKNLLRSNPHPHPLLVLRGYSSQYLNQLIDFMYFGEVDVAQQDFDEFLRGAKDLQVQGLSEDNTYQPKPKLSKSVQCEKTKNVSTPQPPAPVKAEKTPSPKKILEVVKTKVSLNPMMIDELPTKQVVPPQLQNYTNVTITTLANNEEQKSISIKVKKQEQEEQEQEEDPECFDISDSEETEKVTETSFEEITDGRMIVDSIPEEHMQEVVLKNIKVDSKQNMLSVMKNITVEPKEPTFLPKSTLQPMTFTALPAYTEIPQVEIFVPANMTPPVTINTQDPLRAKVKKPHGMDNSQKLRQKEDDPILKMFSTRSGQGWTCTTCGQAYNQKEAMKVHIQTNHMSGFGHVCDECGKSFRTRGRLLSHIDQNHACS